jgi:uncharacterized membrane protein
MIYSLPLLVLTLPFVPVPPLDSIFFGAFLISLPINGIGFFLHLRAIQVSPLSLTLPYLSFTPVFMILTGTLVLDEMPNAPGIFGICIILHAFAISLAKAAYMISVKRLSVIIGLIYGGVIFKEKNLAVRTIGTLLMVAGAVVITLWGK